MIDRVRRSTAIREKSSCMDDLMLMTFFGSQRSEGPVGMRKVRDDDIVDFTETLHDFVRAFVTLNPAFGC